MNCLYRFFIKILLYKWYCEASLTSPCWYWSWRSWVGCYVSSVYCHSQTVTKELVMSTTATNFSEDRCVGTRKAENCNVTPRGIKGNVAFRGRCERKSCAAALPSIVAVIMCVSISCVVEGNQMPLICSYSCFLFLFLSNNETRNDETINCMLRIRLRKLRCPYSHCTRW